jgi:hypothetical protein
MSKQELINLWHEFHAMLAEGEPPLGLLLLGFNGIAFILWVSRQTSKRTATRGEVAIFIQLVLISGNLLIIFLENIKHGLPDLTRLI